MISIKLSLFGELRRVSVDENALTLDYLLQICRQLYKHHLNDKSKISFAWVDEEGDTIVLSTEEELKEALRIMSSLKMDTFKFFVIHRVDEDKPTEHGNHPGAQSIRVVSETWPRPIPLERYRIPSLLGFGGVPIEARTKLVENFLTSLADIAAAMDMRTGQSSDDRDGAKEPKDAQAQNDIMQEKECGPSNLASQAQATLQTPVQSSAQESSPAPTTAKAAAAAAPATATGHQERPPVIIVKRMTIPLHGSDMEKKEPACTGKQSEVQQGDDTTKATTSNRHHTDATSGSTGNVSSTEPGVAAKQAEPQQPTGDDTGIGISPSEIEAWSTELRLLSDMGLHDIAMLLPLLRVHCLHPAALQHSKAIDPKGMQHVVRSALSLI